MHDEEPDHKNPDLTLVDEEEDVDLQWLHKQIYSTRCGGRVRVR